MSSQPLRALIFDLDFTLYDAADFYRGAFVEIAHVLARRHGGDVDELSTRLMGLWEERGSRYPCLFDDFLRQEELPADDVELMIELFHRHEPSIELYEDARRLLERLEPEIRLCIVTDGNSRMQRGKIRALGLVSRFDPIIITGDLGLAWRKPSPLPYLAACTELGIEPGEAISIGDNPAADAAGPFAIGMPAVRLLRGEYARLADSRDRLFSARIESLDRLLELDLVQERLPCPSA